MSSKLQPVEQPGILFVATIAGTISCFLLPFAAVMRKKGHRVYAAAKGANNSSKCIESFDDVWDLSWSRSALDVIGQMKSLLAIRRIVRSRNIKLIHVHTPIAGFITRLALHSMRKRLGLKVLYTAHGFHFHPRGSRIKNLVFVFLEKIASYWTDHLIVMNKEDLCSARKYNFLPHHQVSYFPGIGVDTDYYASEKVSSQVRSAFRLSIGASEGTNVFLMIADFIPRKRHNDLIDAFVRLARQDVRIVLAGTGPTIRPVAEHCERLGISSGVVFLGHRDDVRPAISAAIATVLPSQQEGLPRSVMESLSMEVPVIVSDIRGSRELVSNGGGLVFELGNIEALSSAMRWVLDHVDESRLMGRIGRQQMQDFSLQHIERLHEQLYDQLLSS